MAIFVLIHGAATDSWYWGPLADELRHRGHEAIAPTMPVSDPSAGLRSYADAVVAGIAEHASAYAGGGSPGASAREISSRNDLVIIAHSFGGFVGPLVCERVGASLLVMLHAQIPAPGESPNEWWRTSGYQAMRDAYDLQPGVPSSDDPRAFALHDSPTELVDVYLSEHQLAQSDAPFGEPWPLASWPQVATRVLISREDHFFPANFLRELTQERLGIQAEEMPGDHAPMLGHPQELANRLEVYTRSLSGG